MSRPVRVTEANFKEVEAKCNIVLDPVFTNLQKAELENHILKK